MYLHCCHLLPLCRWCYCCGSLLLMFISYKCHTQSADIAGPQYQLSVVAQSTDNRLVNDPPTTFVLFFVQHTRLWWIYFAQLVILLNFFQLHKSHREYDSFFMKYFLSAKSSQAESGLSARWVGLADLQYGTRSCFPYGGHAVLSINCKRVLHALAIAGPSDMEVSSGLLKCRRAYE